MVKRVLNFIRPQTFWEYTFAVVMVTVSAVVGYWAIVDRQPAAESISEIVTPVVSPGDTFTVKYNVRWNTACQVTGYRFVIDASGQQYTIAPDQRWVSPQDTPEFSINIPIPLSAVSGNAEYRATIIYRCNPFQWAFPLERTIPAKKFTIAPRKPVSYDTQQCGMERPVLVRAYCRRPALLSVTSRITPHANPD